MTKNAFLKAVLMSLTLTCAATANAQTATNGDLAARVQALEDRAALRKVVDMVSVLADRKDVATQMTFFTENAVLQSTAAGGQTMTLTGRKQIGDAFTAYLATFETVYHTNGQQTVDIQGDKATGTTYCQAVLISNENGKRFRNISGVQYDDEYVRRGETWLIAKRVSRFAWTDRTEVAQR